MASRRYLGIDVGERRIGLALSDPTGVLCTPYAVLDRRRGGRHYERVADIVEREAVTRIVVGLPRTASGETGPQARRVQRWAEGLRGCVAVPLIYWDEGYSSLEAARRLAQGKSTRRRARVADRGLDAAAAAVILQDFLDHERCRV
jgi:putative Holliday junction resolvase